MHEQDLLFVMNLLFVHRHEIIIYVIRGLLFGTGIQICGTPFSRNAEGRDPDEAEDNKSDQGSSVALKQFCSVAAWNRFYFLFVSTSQTKVFERQRSTSTANPFV